LRWAWAGDVLKVIAILITVIKFITVVIYRWLGMFIIF
jgi:hypothetical protein